MSPCAGIDLELNRLGGIDAVLDLFRHRSIDESNGSYLGRIQLGAALVACKIAEIDRPSAPSKCGGTGTTDHGQHGQDFRQRGVEDRSVLSTWGAKALTLVLDALAHGGCSSQARRILLSVAAALGRCTHTAGVTALLFVLLSDGIASRDTQCCRHISRALALGLHESQQCAAATARDEQSVFTLLTLALPGQVKNPKPDSDISKTSRESKPGSIERRRAVEPLWDGSVRENALSCLGSIVKADHTAAKNVQKGGGLRPLFALAMEEEPPLADPKPRRSRAREGPTGDRRPHTSLPWSPTPSSRIDPVLPATSSSDGGSSRGGRPMTTGASSSMKNSLKIKRERPEPTMSAPIADSVRRRGTLVEGVSTSDTTGKGSESRRGGRLGVGGVGTDETVDPTATNVVITKEDTAVLLPPFPMRDGVAQGLDGSRTTSPLGSSGRRRPSRVPVADNPSGGGAAERRERLTLLATAILVGCLRNRGPRMATEAASGSEWYEQPARGRQTRKKVSERNVSRTFVAGGKAVAAEVEPTGAPAVAAPSLSSGAKNSRRCPQGAGTAAVAAGSKGKKHKSKAPPQRVRGRRRSLPSWRGRVRTKTETPEDTEDPDVLGGNVPAADPAVPQNPRRDGQSTELEGVSTHILGNFDANDGGSSEKEGLTALQGLSRDRRLEGCGAVATVFSDLEHLCGAISRAPELMNASNPLHQELGVVILERGVEASIGKEQGNEEENAGRSEQSVAGEECRKDETRLAAAAAAAPGAAELASSPQITRKQRKKQQQLLRSVVAGGGTSLRSLCWLLLHRSRDVSEGAAAVLLALTSTRRCQLNHDNEVDSSSNKTSANTDSSSGTSSSTYGLDHDEISADTAAIFPWVVLSVIEQGCMPILRMAAGRPGPTDNPSLPLGIVDTQGGVSAPLGAHAGMSAEVAANASTPVGARPNEKRRKSQLSSDVSTSCPLPPSWSCRPPEGNIPDSAATNAAMAAAAPRVCTSISRQAARKVLTTVIDEACARHVERLVRSVTLSGNIELRTNVSLGLVILCTCTGPQQGGQVWRSFVSCGALAAVLGMMRSPTARLASVSFLRAVSALLQGLPEPQDSFDFGKLAGPAQEQRSPKTVEDQEGIGDLARPSKSTEGGGDTVILVRDPLASLGSEEGARGGKAEREGIKMACPRREVICLASPVLRGLILGTPKGELPLLHGRYRTWEELMAHMGAPHTFASTNASYSTEFVLEMLVLATTFEIEATGYARELRRRLGSLLSGRANGSRWLPVERPATDQESTRAASTPLPEGSEASSSGSIDAAGGRNQGAVTRAGSEKLKALGAEERMEAPSPLQEKRLVRVQKGVGTSSSDSSGEVGRRRRAESTVFEMLDAAVRCRHAWLSGEVFREASKMMGTGDGEGLPASPRELTALLSLLRRFLSFLWVADGRRGENKNGS